MIVPLYCTHDSKNILRMLYRNNWHNKFGIKVKQMIVLYQSFSDMEQQLGLLNLQAINLLQERVTALERRNQELERRNQELEKRVQLIETKPVAIPEIPKKTVEVVSKF